MPDSLSSDDQDLTAEVLPAKPAKSAAAQKAAEDAKALAAARNADTRLGKILAGAATLKTTAIFRGPLDYAALTKLHKDFGVYDKAVVGTKKVGSSTGEALAVATRDCEGRLKTIVDFVDPMYPPGTEGRAAFFVPGGGQKPLDAEFAAALAGLAKDHAGPKLIPPTPETDVKAGTAALHRLESAQKAWAAEAATHDENKSLRAQAGKDIRVLVKRAEQLVRTYHKAHPALLLKYGLKPGTRVAGLNV